MSTPTVLARLQGHPSVRLLRSLEQQGALVHFRTVERRAGGRVVVDGRSCIMLASNDYLGLRWDPRVIAAAQQATLRYGSGSGGSRLVAGNIPLHRALEERLAEWMQREDVLLFTTGYQSNLGVLSTVFGPGDTVLCDGGVHASLIDGCRLAGADIRRFRRRDLNTLRTQLQATDPAPAGVVFDAVYSMTGDVAPLDAVIDAIGGRPVCTLLDEAHSLGVFGPRGGGLATASPAGRRIDLVTATLSKALASCGGIVAGTRETIQALRVQARSLIFSTASVPAALGAGLAALDIVLTEPEHRQRLWRNVERFHGGLRALGIDTAGSDSPIVPAVIGDEARALQVARDLMSHGVCAGVAVHPGVAQGAALIRFSVTADLSPEDIDQTLDITQRVFRANRWGPALQEERSYT